MSPASFQVYIIWRGTTPLYVGQTNNLARRFKEHAAYGVWFGDETHVSLIACETRDEALRIESRQISKLRPLHNLARNPRRQSVAECIARYEWAEEFRRLDAIETARERRATAVRSLRAVA